MSVMNNFTYEQKYRKSKYLRTPAKDMIKLMARNIKMPTKINLQILDTD
jgi:hypothetical protein